MVLNAANAVLQQRGGDWVCSKCGTNNFKKRDNCFKCNIKRDESEALAGDGFNEIGVMPCDTLLLRNVPVTADEQRILVCLNKLTSLDVRRIIVARHKELNNQSRGFAYVEMNGVTEAAQLLTTLTAVTKLNIDGKEIFVSYSKQPLAVVMSGGNLITGGDVQLPIPSSAASFTRGMSISSGGIMQTDVTNAAAAVAQSAIQKAQVMRQVAAQHVQAAHHHQQQQQQAAVQAAQVAQLAAATHLLVPGAALLLQQHHHQQILAAQALQEMAAVQLLHEQQQRAAAAALVTMPPPTSIVNVSAAPPAVSGVGSLCTLGVVQTPYGELPRYPPPDVSGYQYDNASSYYYDASTGLYYDAKTQYYYNSETQQFLYWDASYQTYLPAAPASSSSDSASTSEKSETEKQQQITTTTTVTNETASVATTAAAAAAAKPEKKDKNEKLNMAKKIQKDMEKWAKQCNSQKKEKETKPTTGANPGPPPPAAVVEETAKASGSADAAFSVLEKTSSLTMGAGLVSYEAGDSDEEGGTTTSGALPSNNANCSIAAAADQAKDIDWEKLACLLCRRQFPSREVLLKHQQFSDLHKQNLAMKQSSKNNNSLSATEQLIEMDRQATFSGGGAQYRDRAKERREKFGLDDRPLPNKLKEKYLASLGGECEQPTASGIKSDNIGNKLLKNMGWKEGQGLGRANQGIVDPISQKRRTHGAGLGASNAVLDAPASGTYKDHVRAALRQKYYDS